MTALCRIMRRGGRGLKVALAAALLAAAASAPAARADGVPDPVLAGFHGAKLGLAVLVAGTALTDGDAGAAERVTLATGALLVAVPSTLVLIAARRGDAGALRHWRTVSFVVDLGLSATAAAYGAWLIGSPRSSLDAQYAGLACLSVGLFGALLSGLDLVPFRVERAETVRR